MGVRGLTRFCYQHEARASRASQALADVTLAVDFVGFQFFVCNEIARQIERESNIPAPMWLLLGGCPIRLEQYVERWLQRLEAARVSLLFVADPPQCFLGVGHSKTMELQERAQQKVAKLRELRQSLFEAAPTATSRASASQKVELRADKKDVMRAYLQEAQGCFPFSREKLRSVLKRHGVRIVTATREADDELAQLVRDGQAYAVLANDSDFLVMRGVRYIPFSKLRVDDKRVSARVFSPELVAAALEIEPHQLVDLALLCTNDYTQQLDVEFKFSKVMNFPRSPSSRSGDDAISPEHAAFYIRTRPVPMIDDPRIQMLATHYGAPFINTLGGIYEFYGYGDEFKQRYHMTSRDADVLRMPEQEMRTYKQLLDQHDFPSSIVDVLYSRSRRLKQQFDIVAAMMSTTHPGKSMNQLLAPTRSLLYQALGVGVVREMSYDPTSGQHLHHDVALPSLEFLRQFLSSAPINKRSHAAVEQAWRSLIFKLLYDNENGRENAAFLWKLLGKQSPYFKSVVSSLLLLWKCDSMHLPRENRLVNMERLEVLLLTALVCVSLRDDRVPPAYEYEPAELSIEWEVYASVGGFVEVLRVVHFLRIVLGEKLPPTVTTSCPSLFSAEVFLPVYSIIRSTRSPSASADPVEGRALTRAQVDSVLCYYVSDMHDDERAKKWDRFCQMRAVLNRLVELMTPEGVEDTAPVKQQQPELARPPAPAPVVTDIDTHSADSVGQATPSKSSLKGKKKPPKGKKNSTPKSSKTNKQTANKSANGGKIVSGSITVLNPAADEFHPPMPSGPPPVQLPPPPPILHGGNGNNVFSTGNDLSRVPEPPIQPSPQSSKNGSGKNGGKKQNGGSGATLLTPAAVAKRMGKSSAVPKKGAKSTPPPTQNGNFFPPPPPPPLPPQEQPQTNGSLQGLIERLPVYSHRHEILKNISSNQLTIIQGETGCGKSTSVPQFILDEWLRDGHSSRPVNIYVTQPRRIAAIELAKTVAKMREGNEFDEDGAVGKVVGYRIGQKHCTSGKTKITYVTTGYMVERLIHDSEALQSMTHLVIDEVHERSMDVDALLLLLKLQLKNHDHLRIIIMSATMDAKVLIKYFTKSMATKLVHRKPLFVGTKLYPVENLYIDDIASVYPNLVHVHRNEFMRIHTELEKVLTKGASANGELGQQVIQNVHESQLKLIPSFIQQLMVEHHHHRFVGGSPQCILVFLPGIGSINRLYEELGMYFQSPWSGINVSITVLHSTLELEQQQTAFAPIEGMSTKIVLATNIAESSVTIPDVTHVINCGMEKQIQMPNAKSTHAEVLVDVWCSRASVQQRSGRAGRLMAGVAFHLFSHDFMFNCMSEFTTPEILRKPLDRIVLQLKGKLHEFGVPSDLLRQALDAPDLNHIDGAYKLLAHYDAIDSEDEESAKITSFGSFVCHMPLSMELCRLMLMGKNIVGNSDSTPQARAYLLASTIILVAILASPDLFVMPSWFHSHSATKYMAEMKANLNAKLAIDGGAWSEPLAMWRFYVDILGEHTLTKRPNVMGRLKKFGISTRRYQALNLLISDTCERFVALARQGSLELDAASMQMLLRLDNYASSQRVDKEILQFAKATLACEQHDMDVLRFLVIHNYSDHLISGRLTEGSHFDDDDDNDIATTDRVDLSIGKEDGKIFFSLSNAERKELLGHLASTSGDEFVSIAYSGHEVSLYTKPNVPELPGTEQAVSDGSSFDAVLPRMSFPVSLVYYIRDQKFPVDFGHVGQDGKEEKLRFRVSDSSGSSIAWSKAKDNVRVSIGGRSLFALPVRCPPTQKLMAVYADRLFTGDETRMFCSKCTLLPPDAVAYHAVILLATVRGKANVWLQVDTASGDIVAIKLDQQLVAMPSRTALRRDLITYVNAVRECFSGVLQCTPSDEIAVKTLPVETITSVCRDDRIVVKLTKEEAWSRSYEWQQLSMASPSAAERAALREAGLTPPRFPPLV